MVDKVGEGAVTPSTEVLFDNHIPLTELLEMLRHQYSRRTIYKWVDDGMPCKRIKRKLWFPKDEVRMWLERT